MKIVDYINKHFNGNITAFAVSRNESPTQAHRWIARGCEVKQDGTVWCPATKHKKD